ncbi:O-succinylbenzoate synthase [Streptomyces viridochromogenes]|uniref:o-succinylbenzoate synthase n=1 Tax=Streptomyces viridochromogenes TaxID=1938 RepID=A0A0L8K9W3_STRVR|nr:O-succinylbenzoate synthase [Streptomyces viridochromogenes]
MRIVRVELFVVRLPLLCPFTTSSHRKDHLEHILVQVTDQDGATGWGECASPSDPFYGPENLRSCWNALNDYFAPALLATRWHHPGDLASAWDRVQGNHFARAALDIACWDLFARRLDRSLADSLGATAPSVAVGVSLGIEAGIDELLAQVDRYASQGYQRVKLKIAPGWDIAPVAAVRERFPDTPLQVDANGAYGDCPSHRAILRELDRHGLTMIEQPYPADDLLAHARLQRDLATPLCLDESITTPHTARTALALEAARIVNIKVSRLGGLTGARAVHDLCAQAGVPVWCGGMHEFGIGRAANLALAALPAFTYPGDLSGSDRYFHTDIVQPPIQAINGTVPVPTGPGLGVEIDPSALRGHLVRSTILPNAADRPRTATPPTRLRRRHS